MDNTEIVRMAKIIYRSWSEKYGRKQVLSPYTEDTIRIAIDRLETFAKVARTYRTVDIKDSILNGLVNGVRNIHKYIQGASTQCAYAPINIGDIIYDIQQIQRERDIYMTIENEEQQFAFHVDDVDLEGVRLGDFRVNIPCNIFGRALDNIYAFPLTPICMINGNYFHPHVNVQDNKICLGDAADIIGCSLTECRLVDIVDTVDAVLRTYNPSSPYAPISRWTDAIVCCNTCDEEIDDVNIAGACDECGSLMCMDCYEEDSNCGNC